MNTSLQFTIAKKNVTVLAIIAFLLLCTNSSLAATWQASLIKVVDGFDVPESMVFDPVDNVIYVSNIETPKREYWGFDQKGFISRLRADGEIETLRWQAGSSKNKLNAPKGMCVLNGRLYVADINAVWVFTPKAEPKVLFITGAERLNDFATDGQSVYVSDTGNGNIYRMINPDDPNKGFLAIPGPPGLNGITFFKDKMFGVSWGLHEVYELDSTGKRPPQAFGLAEYFKNLDGIEVLDDGTIIVSDYTANKVYAVSPDRKTVSTLVLVDSPADIGLDRKGNRLLVPQFDKNRVAVFKLHCEQ